MARNRGMYVDYGSPRGRRRRRGPNIGMICGILIVIILAVIFGVLLGTFAADAFSLTMMISNGELPGFVLADIPATIIALLVSDADYMRATLGNIGMGLLYAALGVFALIWKAGKEVSGTKFIDLE